jgi:RNA polymerase sigma-70 factor (ECF subfamily)
MNNKLVDNPNRFSRAIELVALNKDQKAFIMLFDHFAPRIKSFALKAGFIDDEADDLAQETLVTIWKKANLYNSGKSSASTWIYAIARNKRIDWLRKKNRPLPDPDDPLIGIPERTQDEVLETEQQYILLKSAVKNLPKPQKEVLMLSFFDDKTHLEISKNLDLPLGTVKSRIRLGLQKLKTVVERLN